MTTNVFDFESLTLNEVEQIELITGASIDQLMDAGQPKGCLLYTSPSPRDLSTSRMPSSA